MDFQCGLFKVCDEEFFSCFTQIIRRCGRVKFVVIDGCELGVMDDYLEVMRQEFCDFTAVYDYLDAKYPDEAPFEESCLYDRYRAGMGHIYAFGYDAYVILIKNSGCFLGDCINDRDLILHEFGTGFFPNVELRSDVIFHVYLV